MKNYVWLRRDLRVEDNTALHYTLEKYKNVQVLFIFDENILKELPKDDARVNFIYDTLKEVNSKLSSYNATVECYRGNPEEVWKEIIQKNNVESVNFNRDYEPYASERDTKMIELFEENSIVVSTYKDQVIFESNEVLKNDGLPYTVYTPYKNKWLANYTNIDSSPLKNSKFNSLFKQENCLKSKEYYNINPTPIKVKPYTLKQLENYSDTRNYPSTDGTSYLSPHLRFGTISVRQVIEMLSKEDEIFLSELIWREFFMQILAHFPKVQSNNFKSKYDGVKWRNNEDEFKKWCKGETGYPMVDAGMRQLNETGYMHNRVRMVTASFLCKHLLIDWRWGEAYFAKKLLDYDLSANNGNWQWSAGTGCDSTPYFRIFNPTSQIQKFDKDLKYIKEWVKDFNELTYPNPMVDHKFARERCLNVYKEGLGK